MLRLAVSLIATSFAQACVRLPFDSLLGPYWFAAFAAAAVVPPPPPLLPFFNHGLQASDAIKLLLSVTDPSRVFFSASDCYLGPPSGLHRRRPSIYASLWFPSIFLCSDILLSSLSLLSSSSSPSTWWSVGIVPIVLNRHNGRGCLMLRVVGIGRRWIAMSTRRALREASVTTGIWAIPGCESGPFVESHRREFIWPLLLPMPEAVVCIRGLCIPLHHSFKKCPWPELHNAALVTVRGVTATEDTVFPQQTV